jgi:hypothetical protein
VVVDGEDNNPQHRQIPPNKSFGTKTAKGQRPVLCLFIFFAFMPATFLENTCFSRFSRKNGRRIKRRYDILLLYFFCVFACKKAARRSQINQSKPSCMEILVFKTDVRSRKRVTALAPHLQRMKGIIKWNVDLQDVDKVLRIECNSIAPAVIENSLQQAGYYCEELTD